MKEKYILGIVLVVILGGLIFWMPKNSEQDLSNEPLIGGERDEHGCLGPAGYSWNVAVNACLREWESDAVQKQAAKIAVEYVGAEKGLTVLQVLTAGCEGCFMVELEKGAERIKLILANNAVVENSSRQ